VIDDHPPLIELLRRYLTQTRCQVIGVSDGFEALALARSLQPDGIILDVMMPNIDGWEVLQRLHNTPELAHTPVIICSIFNDPKLAYSLGAVAVLQKPVKREELLTILRQLNLIE
jgi:CheY-like chemotaxis protein